MLGIGTWYTATLCKIVVQCMKVFWRITSESILKQFHAKSYIKTSSSETTLKSFTNIFRKNFSPRTNSMESAKLLVRSFRNFVLAFICFFLSCRLFVCCFELLRTASSRKPSRITVLRQTYYTFIWPSSVIDLESFNSISRLINC